MDTENSRWCGAVGCSNRSSHELLDVKMSKEERKKCYEARKVGYAGRKEGRQEQKGRKAMQEVRKED